MELRNNLTQMSSFLLQYAIREKKRQAYIPGVSEAFNIMDFKTNFNLGYLEQVRVIVKKQKKNKQKKIR